MPSTSMCSTAAKAGAIIAEAASTRRPRTRYTIGRDGALITRLTRVPPGRLMDRVIAAGLRRYA
jgi:hypothetical protein